MNFLSDALEFPLVESANEEGLLAIGGDLSPARLLLAYRSGIFPWFNDDTFIMWWSPDPRMVLCPNKVKISKSMRKVLKNNQFYLTKNVCFNVVIEHCSKLPRNGQDGTWITPKMQKAYVELHKIGYAVSYEVWQNNALVGGLYGIDLGNVFCGESMFSLVSNASKFAFIKMAQELDEKGYDLIDCQVHNDHLASLGATEISRKQFMTYLR